jgi:hypothetical protein
MVSAAELLLKVLTWAGNETSLLSELQIDVQILLATGGYFVHKQASLFRTFSESQCNNAKNIY